MLETYKELFDYDVQNKRFFTWLNVFSKQGKTETIRKKVDFIENLKFSNASAYQILNKLKKRVLK
jgi:hypothetical protein